MKTCQIDQDPYKIGPPNWSRIRDLPQQHICMFCMDQENPIENPEFKLGVVRFETAFSRAPSASHTHTHTEGKLSPGEFSVSSKIFKENRFQHVVSLFLRFFCIIYFQFHPIFLVGLSLKIIFNKIVTACVITDTITNCRNYQKCEEASSMLGTKSTIPKSLKTRK